jgi:hypothetical protein
MGGLYRSTLKFIGETKGWKSLASEISATLAAEENRVESILSLGKIEQRLDGPLIMLFRATLLVWEKEGRPTWGIGNTKDQILNRLEGDHSEKTLVAWLQDEDRRAGQLVAPTNLPPPRPPRSPPGNVVPTGLASPTAPPTIPRTIPVSPNPQLARGILPSRPGVLPPPPQTPITGRLPVPPPRTIPVPPTVQPTAPVVVPPPPRGRRLSTGPAPSAVQLLRRPDEIMAGIEKMADLKAIFVCDIPTTTSRVYLTEVSSSALVDSSKVNLGNVRTASGWLILGKMVLTNRMGKCWSCAAAVVYKLVADPRFDAIRIESIGAVNFDHHFVVINRDPTTNVESMQTWNPDAILVDAWQANLQNWSSVDPLQPKDAQLAYTWKNFPYSESIVRFFCAFEPRDRATHRGALTSVGKFVQGDVVTKSWRALRTCYEEHYRKGQKALGCPVSGWCDKK